MKLATIYWAVMLVKSTVDILNSCDGASVEKDLSITRKQKDVLDKFKVTMLPKLTHDYMKEDLYLLRWLRARNFNLARAERMLLDNIKWREENKMDTIHEEDWSDIERDYKYYLTGDDKDGRPVQTLFIGEWDYRKAILAGKRNRLLRYLYKVLDHPNKLIRERQEQGLNVTQYYLVYDMSGYNLVQQGCAQCTPLILEYATSYENYFPGSTHKIMMINTPGVFQFLLNSMRPILSANTREAMKIYGTDRSEWQPILLNDIPAENILEDLGGMQSRSI